MMLGAENEHKKVNTQLKDLLSATGMACLTVNNELVITGYTPTVTRYLPLVDSDIGRPIMEFTHAFKSNKLIGEIAEALQTSNPKESEVLSKDGQYLRIRISPYQKADEKVASLVITFTDLTAEKKQKKELTKYKNHLLQLKRVQEAGKVGYWAVYADSAFLEWSSLTYRMFGIPVGKKTTYNDMLTYVHPADIDWVDEMWQKAMKNGKYAVIYRIVTHDGDIKWIETYGDVVFDSDKNFLRALGIVRDITEQKEAEIKLAALARTLKRSQKIGHLGSWTFDPASPYFELNEESKVMFGFSFDQQISINDWLAKIHPDDYNRVLTTWTKAINVEGSFDLEYKIIVNHSIKWINAVGEVEFNSHKEFIRAVGVVKDITEHIKQQEDLRVAKEQAETASKLKSAFLANMSHEIRTPLNGIIGFSELLIQTPLNKTQNQYMTTVNQSAQSLLGLVNDILDFSKIEVGKLELAEEKVDLNELVDQVKDIISYQAKEKQLNVWVKVDHRVPRFIISDGIRLRQVLTNLMSNAIKFTHEGEVELSIQPLNTDDQSTAMFRFSVRDTGIGISAENQVKIFEAFTQEDSSTTKKFGGTGLGLSISNGILALMHSSLQLDSKRDSGSVFYFDLALRPYQEEQAIAPASSSGNIEQETMEADKPLESDIKVLIVEDNLINIMLFSILVQEVLPKGKIVKAHNGVKAVEEYQKEKPDLILMDIQMPLMNGHDATRKIREIEGAPNNHQHRSTPILALTAATMESDIQKCKEVGMDDFIGKPIDGEMFKSVIKKWISPTAKSKLSVI
ncbi:MAG: ATP-binding protein [Cyclobacteriaceae bacterium]